VCLSILQHTSYLTFGLYRKMRKPDPVTQAKRSSSGGFLHAAATAAPDADVPIVTERARRKSCPRLPVDDSEESDGSQADEEPLAGSRARTGLANVDTRRRSAVVVTASSRRSLIEDDEADSTTCSCDFVEKLLYMLLYALFFCYPIMSNTPLTGPDAVSFLFIYPLLIA
jgi:hypothetical protein